MHASGVPTHATLDLMIETANFNTIVRSVKSPLSFFVKMRGDIVGPDGDPDSMSREQQIAWDSKVEDYRTGYEAMLNTSQADFQRFLRVGPA